MANIQKLIQAALLFVCLFALPAFAEVVRLDDNSVSTKLSVPVHIWQDKSVPPKGIVVAVHGLTFYALAFDDLATYLAKRGYTFYAADLRGFGRWKTEAAKFHGDTDIHFTKSEDDLLNLLTLVREQNPQCKIYCLGESLGANYALWVASVKAPLIDGVIAGSPCVKLCVHPRLRWGIDTITGLLHPKTPLNLEPYINPYLSHDKSVTRSCLKDPKICRSLSPTNLVKTSITNKKTLENVGDIPKDMPILIIAGEKDRVFQAKALVKFVPLLGSKNVSLKVLKGKGHLLLEHQPVKSDVVSIIDDWLDQRNSESITTVTIH